MPFKIFITLFFYGLMTLGDVKAANINFLGGIAVGNGGSVVRCSGKQEFFFIDTVIYKNIYQKDLTLAEVKTLKKSLLRIEKIIAAKIPSLLESFQEFKMSLQPGLPVGLYKWQPLNNEPPELPIENLTGGLRWPCANSMGSITILQAISRIQKTTDSETKITFMYERNLFSTFQISKKELSLLLVHEWIWGLTTDATLNARLNYFLHSTLIDSLSKRQVQEQLARFGLIETTSGNRQF